MKALSIRSWATASWHCSARRSPMKTTRCGPAMPHSGCRRASAAIQMSFAERRVWRCRFASGSTLGTSWCARSAAICAWITRPLARPRTWQPAWSSLRRQAASSSPAETLRLVEGLVEVTPLGPVPVKGLGAPIEIFELVGAGAARTRLEAAEWRGLTRFVGRSAEMEQLRDALDQAGLGRGQVVAVVGEPGVGKSRLFWEFSHSHRVRGWLIVQSSSVSYGKATAPTCRSSISSRVTSGLRTGMTYARSGIK